MRVKKIKLFDSEIKVIISKIMPTDLVIFCNSACEDEIKEEIRRVERILTEGPLMSKRFGIRVSDRSKKAGGRAKVPIRGSKVLTKAKGRKGELIDITGCEVIPK